MQALDIRGYQLGSASAPATFTTKAEAAKVARSLGWQSGDVLRAANRFQAFWLIGQDLGPVGHRALCNDGEFRDLPLTLFNPEKREAPAR